MLSEERRLEKSSGSEMYRRREEGSEGRGDSLDSVVNAVNGFV